MLKLMLFAVILATGCSQLIRQSPLPDPDPTVTFNFRVIPIITQDSTGQQSWTLTEINRMLKHTNEILKGADIALSATEFLSDPDPERNVIDGYPEFLALEPNARAFYSSKNALPIWFVKRLTVNGANMGGASSYPSVPLFNYTTVISRHSGLSTLAHEIGHLFNLPHAWELTDRFPESTYTTQETCHSQCNNLMSYCKFRGADECESLWPSQVKEMRKWVFSSQRSRALINGAAKVRAMRSLNSTLRHSNSPTCLK